MKEKIFYIIEFTIIKPRNSMETIGEKLELTIHGEYCPSSSLRGYHLIELLDHPDNYKASAIVERTTLSSTIITDVNQD